MLSLLLSHALPRAAARTPADATISSGALLHDTDGRPLHAHGAGILLPSTHPAGAGGKFYMVGPGGYELKLSPGSEVFDTEDSKAGHMMLPCSHFKGANRQQNRQEAQTFLVGDYFSPQETRAVRQCLPVSERIRRWERNPTAGADHDASS